MTIRPAATDQQPAVYGATQPARLVITETVAASRTQGDGPWTTAEAILGALERAGYRIFRPVDESLDVWGDERPPLDREGYTVAPRASEAVRGDGSPTPDVGAAQGGDDGSAAESEPRPPVPVQWVEAAAKASSNHFQFCDQGIDWPDCQDCRIAYDRAHYALAAVIPAIRAQVADEVTAHFTQERAQVADAEPVTLGGVHEQAKLLGRYDRVIATIDRIARGDQ